MNVWAEKSIKIANSPGYLDALSAIYPAILGSDRPLDQQEKQIIKQLHSKQRGKELVSFLLGLKRKKHPFPFEHPYVSLLMRKKPDLFKRNPEIVKVIGDILLSMKHEDIIRGCERPADINRMMGPMFRNWLQEHFPAAGYSFVPKPKFQSSKGIVFLAGTDTELREYANTILGCNLFRGVDFLVKLKSGKYLIGEARFFSAIGGSQSRDLDATLEFARTKIGKAIRVAVIDGVVWFHKGYLFKISKLDEDEYALSALLLQEFLDSLRQRHASTIV
jgi:hypothetical protein